MNQLLSVICCIFVFFPVKSCRDTIYLQRTDQYIDKKNLCPKCEGLLREAVQTIACGHRYCKTCVETILR